jgi:type I restriction enzyme, S subunit
VSDLPEGWAEPSIKELFVFKYGKGLPQELRSGAGGIPVYGSNGMVGEHDSAITKGVTIIVGRKGSVGEVHISPEKCWPIDTTYFIDEFLCELPPDYWALYLKSLGLGQQEKSSAIPGISRDDIYRLSVPLPPLNEQRRILAKLEESLSKVEASQNRLAKIPVILKRLRQSVLAAACSGRLTADCRDKNHAPIWEEKTLGELILEKPKNGYSAKPVKYRTPFRVLTLTATTSGEFKPEHFKYFDGPVDADSGLWLQPNDILVQRGNTIEYVGVPAIYDGRPNEFIYPDLMMRFRARPEVDSKFLYFALSWERSRNYLRKRATGTAGSMPKINQQTLIGVPIDLPPLAEQRKIVRRVDALFKFADQIEVRYQKALGQIERLTQSILAKAFRGELVPTEAELARREGREFEPASVLLDRIHSASGC